MTERAFALRPKKPSLFTNCDMNGAAICRAKLRLVGPRLGHERPVSNRFPAPRRFACFCTVRAFAADPNVTRSS